MEKYFSVDYTGKPFIFFGAAHIGALLLLVLLNLLLLRVRRADKKTKKTIRWTLAILMWLDESAWHIWNIVNGMWNVQEHLPLHVCSVLI